MDNGTPSLRAEIAAMIEDGLRASIERVAGAAVQEINDDAAIANIIRGIRGGAAYATIIHDTDRVIPILIAQLQPTIDAFSEAMTEVVRQVTAEVIRDTLTKRIQKITDELDQ